MHWHSVIQKLTRSFLPGAQPRSEPLSLKAPAGKICCIVAYLKPHNAEIVAFPTDADIVTLAAEVRADIQQMKALCLNPQQSIPLAKDQFPMTETPGYCRHCQFRQLCDRVESV